MKKLIILILLIILCNIIYAQGRRDTAYVVGVGSLINGTIRHAVAGSGLTQVNDSTIASKLRDTTISSRAALYNTTLDLRLSNAIWLPNTTSAYQGVVYKGTFPFLHNYADASSDGLNFFAGGAGNFTMHDSTAGTFYGSANTGTGWLSIQDNWTGYDLTAYGKGTLYHNTIGNWNSAFGVDALQYNTTGNQNTALGVDALHLNVIGSSNLAVGNSAAEFQTAGDDNVAIGVGASQFNTSGAGIVAVGTYSLQNSVANFQTAVGEYSGRSLTSGASTTNLGKYAGYNALQKVDAVNSMALGANTYTTKDNQVVLGDINVTETLLRGTVGLNNASPDASTILDITSTTKGARFPVMTLAQRNAISSPVSGLHATISDSSYRLGTYTGSAWRNYAFTGEAESILTFGTGLTRTVNTITVNTSQNISTLSNLTSNGLVTTSGGTGALSITTPGTGVLTALGVNVGSAGAFVIFNGALGTPSSGTLTNATGLPLSGLSGLGTSVATALAVNVGTAGSFVVNGGVLGTPSSGTATNLTGTASGLTAGNVTTIPTLSGDVTNSGNAITVTKINGTSLAGLATGILKNTAGTGVPSIAVAGTDYVTPAASALKKDITDSVANGGYTTIYRLKATTAPFIRAQEILSTNKMKAVTVGAVNVPTASFTLLDQQIQFTMIYVRDTMTITGVKWWQSNGSTASYTANNYNGWAIYSLSAGTLTLIDSTANDGNIWKGGQAVQTKAFTATRSLTEGVYVIAALYCRSAEVTAPVIGAVSGTGNTAVMSWDFGNSVKLSAHKTAVVTPPLSQAYSGLTGNINLLYTSVYAPF